MAAVLRSAWHPRPRRASLGCVLEDETFEYVSGYNDEVSETLARGEASSSSFLQKLTTRAALEEKFRRAPYILLAVCMSLAIAGLRFSASRREVWAGYEVLDLAVVDAATKKKRFTRATALETRALSGIASGSW